MGSVTVYIAAWELRCCGAPIVVGSPAVFLLSSEVDREWLNDCLGKERAATVTAVYSHHSQHDDPVETHGTIRPIGAIFQQYTPPDATARTRDPIPGTGSVESRTAGNGYEPPDGVRTFLGYVVELETA